MALVSTGSPQAVGPVLKALVVRGSVKPTGNAGEFSVEAEMYGESAKELNRSILSALRRVEKKTRLRSEWSSEFATERFFDYVPKRVVKRSKG